MVSRDDELKEEAEKIDVDKKPEIKYNRKSLYKQITRKEYAIISSRIMEDNSRYMALNQELPRYGTARSADYFYVYENFAPGNFGVLKQIKITDGNRQYIASIEAIIGENNDESIIRSASELNRVLEVLKNQARRNRRNNALDSEGRANINNGGISLGEPEGYGIGYSQQGARNSGGLKEERITDSAEKSNTFSENSSKKIGADEPHFELKEKEKYSEYDKPITVKDVEVLRSIRRESINEFTSEDIEKAQKWAYKFYREIGTKSPFFRAWFGEWRAHDVAPVGIADIPAYVGTNEARKSQRGNVVNADTGWEIRISREGETNTISHSGDEHLSEYGLSGIRSLVENAVLLDSEVHEHHSNNAKNDMIAFDHKLYSLGKDTSGNIAVYRITVEEYFQSKSQPNEKRFHNLKYIEKVAEVSADANVEQSHKDGSTMRNSTTTYSISDLYRFVKTFDKEFSAVHFGTLNASHERYKGACRKKYIINSFYKECYVNITNPAVIDFDPMTWSVFSTAYKLNEQGIITDEEISKLQTLDGFHRADYDSDASVS